jgi:hypothetical protein
MTKSKPVHKTGAISPSTDNQTSTDPSKVEPVAEMTAEKIVEAAKQMEANGVPEGDVPMCYHPQPGVNYNQKDVDERTVEVIKP